MSNDGKLAESLMINRGSMGICTLAGTALKKGRYNEVKKEEPSMMLFVVRDVRI